jgi:uncharacterized protein Veg
MTDTHEGEGYNSVMHKIFYLGNNRGMIKANVTINSIKQYIGECYQKPVTVKLNLGRNKYVTFPATVSGIYPSIFTVEPVDKNYLGKTAYAYSEILCGKVKISSHIRSAESTK